MARTPAERAAPGSVAGLVVGRRDTSGDGRSSGGALDPEVAQAVLQHVWEIGVLLAPHAGDGGRDDTDAVQMLHRLDELARELQRSAFARAAPGDVAG